MKNLKFAIIAIGTLFILFIIISVSNSGVKSKPDTKPVTQAVKPINWIKINSFSGGDSVTSTDPEANKFFAVNNGNIKIHYDITPTPNPDNIYASIKFHGENYNVIYDAGKIPEKIIQTGGQGDWTFKVTPGKYNLIVNSVSHFNIDVYEQQ